MNDREPSPTIAPVQQKLHTVDVQVPVKEESPSPPSPTASVVPNSEAPSSPPGRTPRKLRTLAQRRACLRDDPLSGDVEAHRIYCRVCEKWIRLAANAEYSPANWQTHKQRCRGSRATPSTGKRSFSPSSRVATTERKILLLNDPQAKDLSATHVHCGTCKTAVALEGDVEYDLTKWTEHKEKCIPKTPAPITPQGSRPSVFPPTSTSSTHSQIFAARSSTPTGEDSQSTETTAVTEGSPAVVKIGVKRGRDEDTDDDEEVGKDERPTNRSRIETDKPPEKDAKSLFGMLMQPLKAFARGFREGLDST